MKRSLFIAITLVTLTSAATQPPQASIAANGKRQELPRELRDGGGSEPPCPPAICSDPRLR